MIQNEMKAINYHLTLQLWRSKSDEDFSGPLPRVFDPLEKSFPGEF